MHSHLLIGLLSHQLMHVPDYIRDGLRTDHIVGEIKHSSQVDHPAYGQLACNNFQLWWFMINLANPPNHIHMRSVDSLLIGHFVLPHHWWFTVIPLIHPHKLGKHLFNTSLVVHGHSANPPIHTMRGSAHGIILSIRLPSHFYVRKMWCNSF